MLTNPPEEDLHRHCIGLLHGSLSPSSALSRRAG